MRLCKEGGAHGNCFFFQAEDGIRDRDVTGVQTCARPIARSAQGRRREAGGRQSLARAVAAGVRGGREAEREIGRASCRERVWMRVVAGSLIKKKNEGREGYVYEEEKSTVIQILQ